MRSLLRWPLLRGPKECHVAYGDWSKNWGPDSLFPYSCLLLVKTLSSIPGEAANKLNLCWFWILMYISSGGIIACYGRNFWKAWDVHIGGTFHIVGDGRQIVCQIWSLINIRYESLEKPYPREERCSTYYSTWNISHSNLIRRHILISNQWIANLIILLQPHLEPQIRGQFDISNLVNKMKVWVLWVSLIIPS